MKLKRLSIENVTSYRDPIDFVFDAGLNILIGPNGGGKSNLQRTLALVLSEYFIRQYEFRHSDTEATVELLELWNRRQLKQKLAPHLGREMNDQVIEIELAPDPADVENIRTIGANLERFNDELTFWESPHETYDPLLYVDEIETTQSFVYRIKNLNLEAVDKESAAGAFQEYLRTFFIFKRIVTRIPDLDLTAPVFFFFSERTSTRDVLVQTGQLTEQHYQSGMRSAYQAAMGENTDLLKWGAQHFARIHWRAVNKAAEERGVTTSDLLSDDADVELLSHYLFELGYEWGFRTDPESVTYEFVIRKADADGPWLTADKFSSGEREIVHFLLAMFALNVQDGLILVDEPELHLHPRWQRIFLGLFAELAETRNNQFVLATHSPVFVTPDTVDSITRIYKPATSGSDRVALRDVMLPKKKNLVRMINSQNNERVFFADAVVLVEGITDRLVLAGLLDATATRVRNYQAIEIIEVGGKNNFEDYRNLLNALQTPSYIVADLDYLLEIGSPAARSLFERNPTKEWKALTDKKSTDAATGVELLEKAVEDGDTAELAEFLEYVAGRSVRLRDPLEAEDQSLLNEELERLRSERTFLLRQGEIEAYLPSSVSGVRAIVEMTTETDWINRIPDSARRAELVEVVCEILGVTGGDRAALEQEAQEGTVRFRASPTT